MVGDSSTSLGMTRAALLKSRIKRQPSVHPFTAFVCKNGQFFVHKLGLADRAPHSRARRSVPIVAHFFAGVAAPAFHECAFGENVPVDFRKVGFVQTRFGRTIDHVAIIEHEACPIGMAEIFEGSNLQRSTWLTVTKIIDHVSTLVEVNKTQIELVAHGIDVPDQIDSILLRPLNVGGLVNQPRNHQVRSKLRAQLLGPNARGMYEIRPPMIMWLGFVFLSPVERDATSYTNPLALLPAPLRRRTPFRKCDRDQRD